MRWLNLSYKSLDPPLRHMTEPLKKHTWRQTKTFKFDENQGVCHVSLLHLGPDTRFFYFYICNYSVGVITEIPISLKHSGLFFLTNWFRFSLAFLKQTIHALTLNQTSIHTVWTKLILRIKAETMIPRRAFAVDFFFLFPLALQRPNTVRYYKEQEPKINIKHHTLIKWKLNLSFSISYSSSYL